MMFYKSILRHNAAERNRDPTILSLFLSGSAVRSERNGKRQARGLPFVLRCAQNLRSLLRRPSKKETSAQTVGTISPSGRLK